LVSARGEIARLGDYGAGGRTEADPQSRALTIWASVVLPRPGGPRSRTWSSASSALAGGGDEDFEVGLGGGLACEIIEGERPQRAVDLLARRSGFVDHRLRAVITLVYDPEQKGNIDIDAGGARKAVT